MKFLLDTAIFLWSLDSFQKLNSRAQQVLESGQEVFLSAASSWEIVIKSGTGKLRLPKAPRHLIPEAMTKFAVQALPIAHAHALAVAELPGHHRDPFDRLLIAQARTEGMTLMTADAMFTRYSVDILWCGK
ncbi:MAG TPA: type II toxin-antitoxin system VapC family toxin [Candidatus Angelobacter sp.]